MIDTDPEDSDLDLPDEDSSAIDCRTCDECGRSIEETENSIRRQGAERMLDICLGCYHAENA